MVKAADVSGDAELDIIIAIVSAHFAKTSAGTFLGTLPGKLGDTGVTPRGVGGGGTRLLSTVRESGAGGSIACTKFKYGSGVIQGVGRMLIPEAAPCPANRLYATFKLSWPSDVGVGNEPCLGLLGLVLSSLTPIDPSSARMNSLTTSCQTSRSRLLAITMACAQSFSSNA